VGLLLAFPLGLARSSKNKFIAAAPYTYIFFFRGTPLLVQLFLLYYGLSQFDWVRESVLWTGHRIKWDIDWPWLGFEYKFRWRIQGLRNAFVCAVFTMTLHTAAYIAEILRGAIQAVPKGEIEASMALGMTRWQAMKHIILPRAIRIGLPAYSNEVILMLKASALASTVTVMELTGAASTLSAKTYLQAEFYILAGALYLAISFVLIQIFKLLEYWLGVQKVVAR